MIYKLCNKLNKILYAKYMKSKLQFSSSSAKKNCIIETGVKIYNSNIIIGDNVKLYHNVIIFGNGPVIIEDGSRIGYNTIIYANKNGGVRIGKNCAIAAFTYIIDTNHSTGIIFNSIPKDGDVSEEVVIGDNVWISAQCVIAKGSKLGNNVVVGANSFVNKEFSDNSIIAGSPARLIKYRGE